MPYAITDIDKFEQLWNITESNVYLKKIVTYIYLEIALAIVFSKFILETKPRLYIILIKMEINLKHKPL